MSYKIGQVLTCEGAPSLLFVVSLEWTKNKQASISHWGRYESFRFQIPIQISTKYFLMKISQSPSSIQTHNTPFRVHDLKWSIKVVTFLVVFYHILKPLTQKALFLLKLWNGVKCS